MRWEGSLSGGYWERVIGRDVFFFFWIYLGWIWYLEFLLVFCYKFEEGNIEDSRVERGRELGFWWINYILSLF